MKTTNNQTTLQTVDAEMLLATPLKPIRWIVQDIIPQGMHILAGSPKIGKSWLMLNLCLQVAKGKPLWEYETSQCDVLYLCLEDTFNRIQKRMFEITDTAPNNLHFCVTSETLDDGLKEQIEGFMRAYPNTGLIVIDTFQKIRGLSMNPNSYANDYADVSVLKAIADKHRVAIILVHHLRKDVSSDPVMMVSGSTGITGGVDCNYVLLRSKRSLDSAKLIVSGRDTEYREIALKFEDCRWHFMGCDNAEDIRKRNTPDILLRIVEFMSDKDEWIGCATELLAAMEDSKMPSNTVTKILNQHHDTFLLENRIMYRYERVSGKRLISLSRMTDDSSVSVSETPSQPSSLS